eukprot:768448-Hanusia_phi.AAC.9
MTLCIPLQNWAWQIHSQGVARTEKQGIEQHITTQDRTAQDDYRWLQIRLRKVRPDQDKA